MDKAALNIKSSWDISLLCCIDSELDEQFCTDHGCKWDARGKNVKCFINREKYGYEVILII